MIIRDNFSCFSLKLCIVTPDLNCLIEMVQMRGHNICFYAKLRKIIPNYHQLLLLFIWNSVFENIIMHSKP